MAGCDLRMIVFEHSLHRARELFTTKFARGRVLPYQQVRLRWAFGPNRLKEMRRERHQH